MDYKKVYDLCREKATELKIRFDFKNNAHIQSPKNLDDIYKNFVYHSQNRSQGYAINFFAEEDKGDPDFAQDVWNCIKGYHFNLNDNYSYIGLFQNLQAIQKVAQRLSLEKGKDIQFLELCKTCQCIKKYLKNYDTLDDFVNAHEFTEDAEQNWKILTNITLKIYNVSTALVPDFFKEQDRIRGREYLIKPDVHVKRFISVLFNEPKDISDKKVYMHLMNMYREYDGDDKDDFPPYKLDKLIYLIGKRLDSPQESKKFAEECRQKAR